MTPEQRWHSDSMTEDRERARENYRPLTGREHEILAMLLSIDAPGIDELRAQVPYVRAAR
jgi:hypothetical protein